MKKLIISAIFYIFMLAIGYVGKQTKDHMDQPHQQVQEQKQEGQQQE